MSRNCDGATITAAFVTVRGNNNIVTGMGCTVIGDSNRVTGMNATVRGNNNKVTGMKAKVYGDNNTVTGMKSKAFGSGNVVTGMKSESYDNPDNNRDAEPRASTRGKKVVVSRGAAGAGYTVGTPSGTISVDLFKGAQFGPGAKVRVGTVRVFDTVYGKIPPPEHDVEEEEEEKEKEGGEEEAAAAAPAASASDDGPKMDADALRTMLEGLNPVALALLASRVLTREDIDEVLGTTHTHEHNNDEHNAAAGEDAGNG